MIGQIIRKFLVVMIIVVPVFSYSGCKKQAKCGCDGDTLFALDKTDAKVYYDASGTSITFQTTDDAYSTYNFCNPQEMFPKFKDYKSGDVLQVSGSVYWDCSYLYQQSNYSYQTYYKVYVVRVTDVSLNLYGKK